jgi:hypothetical protein
VATLEQLQFKLKTIQEQTKLTASQEKIVKKTNYKCWRELAKLNHLLKNYEGESAAEIKVNAFFPYFIEEDKEKW